MFDRLGREITAFGLGAHRDFLLGIARPSVEIVVDRDAFGHSRLGGDPDVPAGFDWPRHARGPYRFVGQFDLSEVPRGPHGLPAVGLLSVFYAHDEDGETFWHDPGYVRVFHFTGPALSALPAPDAVSFGGTAAVGFRLGADVPPWPWDPAGRAAWPLGEADRDAYVDLRSELHHCGRHLLGYPVNTTLGYDPTPGPSWQSLLTLASDDALEWYWHDGDHLVTFIETDRLRGADFSDVRADAG